MNTTLHHLSNEFLEVRIAALGAELQNIILKENGLDYMWSGDPAYWAKKSPVLFPIVGGLKDSNYSFEGKSYSLNRHGFARESLFEVSAKTNNSISFLLQSDETTLAVYPFHFQFFVTYTLVQQTLEVSYLVKNTGDQNMYFSVGAHPAFAVPLSPNTTYTDYYLHFSKQEESGRWPLSPEGLIKSTPEKMLDGTDQLPLTKELFYGDALVFKDLRSTSISIRSDKTPHGLTVNYEGFPYMGIWAFKQANFVCIEPWCGIADSENTNGQLIDKEGINKLSPQESFQRSWFVEVF